MPPIYKIPHQRATLRTELKVENGQGRRLRGGGNGNELMSQPHSDQQSGNRGANPKEANLTGSGNLSGIIIYIYTKPLSLSSRPFSRLIFFLGRVGRPW